MVTADGRGAAAAPDEGAGLSGDGGEGPAAARGVDRAGEGDRAPCLRCGVPLPLRLMGCKGGHCPNCGHPYPHGDCSD